MSVLVVAKFPSVAAVLMALAASVLLLLVAHIMFSFMRLWSCPLARSDNQEKMGTLSLFLFANSRTTFGRPPASLPFTSRPTEKMPSPAGSSITLSPKRLSFVPRWHSRTSGPQFQPPREFQTCAEVVSCDQPHTAPALYENPVPLSMAKLIMTRHVCCAVCAPISFLLTAPPCRPSASRTPIDHDDLQ